MPLACARLTAYSPLFTQWPCPCQGLVRPSFHVPASLPSLLALPTSQLEKIRVVAASLTQTPAHCNEPKILNAQSRGHWIAVRCHILLDTFDPLDLTRLIKCNGYITNTVDCIDLQKG